MKLSKILTRDRPLKQAWGSYAAESVRLQLCHGVGMTEGIIP